MYMTPIVYWFSGTGNSFAVARDVAAGINGRLVPIASVVDGEGITPDTDVIGIVFPVYYVPFGGLPQMIKRFVDKLHGLDSKYIFGVCTYGSAETNTLAFLGRMLAARGGRLAGRFAVNLPENISPGLALNRQSRMFEVWKRNQGRVCGLIRDRRRITISLPNMVAGWAYPLANLIGIPLRLLMKGQTIRSMRKTAGHSAESYDGLMPLMDSGFSAGGSCAGCGTCARVCPTGNISITDKKPVWRHACEYCLACYSWCPNGAIAWKARNSELKYRHPEVRAADLCIRN